MGVAVIGKLNINFNGSAEKTLSLGDSGLDTMHDSPHRRPKRLEAFIHQHRLSGRGVFPKPTIKIGPFTYDSEGNNVTNTRTGNPRVR